MFQKGKTKPSKKIQRNKMCKKLRLTMTFVDGVLLRNEIMLY